MVYPQLNGEENVSVQVCVCVFSLLVLIPSFDV